MAHVRPTLRQGIRSLPAPVWILCVGTFINRFGAFVSVFLVIYLRERGYSVAESGAVVSAYGAGNVLGAAVGGWMADRLGRRNSLAISMFGSATAVMLLSQADSLPLIVVLTVLAGLTGEMWRPASAALLTDLTLPGQRVPAFALNRFMINVGLAAGPATAGFLAEHSFFLVFLGDAITSVAFGLIALVWLPHGVRVRREQERPREGLRTIVHDRVFLFFLASAFLGALVYVQAWSTFPIDLMQNGFSSSDYGLLISINGLAIVLFELPIVSVTQRFRALPVMMLGSLLVGTGFALNAAAETFAAFAATVVIWTLGEMVYSPVAGAWVADFAPERLRGRYQGAFELTFGLAFMLGPVVGAAVYARSADGLWVLCGVVGAAAAGLLLMIGRARGRKDVDSARAEPG